MSAKTVRVKVPIPVNPYTDAAGAAWLRGFQAAMAGSDLLYPHDPHWASGWKSGVQYQCSLDAFAA